MIGRSVADEPAGIHCREGFEPHTQRFLVFVVQSQNLGNEIYCKKMKGKHFIFLYYFATHTMLQLQKMIQNGEKTQGNHEAYAAWAFSSKYNKHHRRLSSVIVRVSVVLKRTVGDSD